MSSTAICEAKLFIVKAGEDQPGRAGLGFAHAAHCAAMGDEVFIFLVLEGAKWAYDEYGKDYNHECFTEPVNCIRSCLDLGAKVVLCVTCHKVYEKEDLGRKIEGVTVGSLNDVHRFLSQPCNTITY
jgi:predicted peroxiredoxin